MSRRARLEAWHTGRPWFTNAVLCVFGLLLVWLAQQFVVQPDHYTIGFSGVSGWSVWVYVASMAIVLTQPVNRLTLWIVLLFAVAMRIVTLRAEPFLSTDIYRYVWDGIVQHAHISPYRYVPGDSALRWLQEKHQEIYENINRKEYARTIYPPVAQMIYWIVTFFSQTVSGMKVGMFLFECVTAGALIGILRLMGRRATDVLLYAWCPLLVWEIGGSGHVDAAILAFVSLAMLFRYREQPVWTGLFLGLAVMTKFYPLVLVPALWRRGDWKMPAMVVAVCTAGYAAYASVGKLVFGFLGGYASEEGLDSGRRFFLLDWAGRHRVVQWVTLTEYKVFCACVLGVIALWAWRHACGERLGVDVRVKRPGFVVAAGAMAFAMMLLFSPHYPWYIAWLLPMFALAPGGGVLVYVCGFFYGFTTQWADPGPKMLLLNTWLYGATAVGIVLGVLWRRWRVWRWFEARDQQALNVTEERCMLASPTENELSARQ